LEAILVDWNFIFSPLSSADGSVLTANSEYGCSYNEVESDYWDATTIYVTADWDEFEGWNLLGNPYASAIDWDNSDAGWDRSKIENFVYYYDGSGYKFYGSGTSYSQGISSSGGSQYIPANQGFFVKALDTGDGADFTIPASARVHNSQSFWKENKYVDPNIIRLTISKDNFVDEMIVRTLVPESGVTEYHDGAYDAYKMFSWDNINPQLYSRNDDNSHFYAVNSIPEFVNHKIVPLGIYIGQAGEYSINITENDFENAHIWLEDRNLNMFTRFVTPTEYSFNQTAETNNDRFFLHFELNKAPTLNDEIPNQETIVDEAYEYYLPVNLFTDENFGDSLTINLLIDGEPISDSWINFNAETNRIYGVPTNVQEFTIAVSATDAFGLKVSDEYLLNVKSLNSNISNIKIDNVIVHPNPTNGIVNINILGKTVKGKILVTDISGKVIISKNISGKQNVIDISNFASGLYFINIETDNGTVRKKVIKK